MKRTVMWIVLLCLCGFQVFGTEYVILDRYRDRGMPDPMLPKVDFKKLPDKTDEPEIRYYTLEEAMRDPMVSRIVVVIHDNPDSDDEIKDPPTVSDIPDYDSFSLLIQEKTASKDYTSALSLCEKALSLIKGEKEKGISEDDRIRMYRESFTRRKGELSEKIRRQEAETCFKDLGLHLNGIIWDERNPVAVLNGNSVSKGYQAGNMTVSDISETSVTVEMKYKGEVFTWVLDL